MILLKKQVTTGGGLKLTIEVCWKPKTRGCKWGPPSTLDGHMDNPSATGQPLITTAVSQAHLHVYRGTVTISAS